MIAPDLGRTPDDLALPGSEIFDRQIRPALHSEDESKSGEYEIDSDDSAAVVRLRARKPAAEIWLMRAGHTATCRIGNNFLCVRPTESIRWQSQLYC